MDVEFPVGFTEPYKLYSHKIYMRQVTAHHVYNHCERGSKV